MTQNRLIWIHSCRLLLPCWQIRSVINYDQRVMSSSRQYPSLFEHSPISAIKSHNTRWLMVALTAHRSEFELPNVLFWLFLFSLLVLLCRDLPCSMSLLNALIWDHTSVYLRHLFDVLWEADLHTDEALFKTRADQADFSVSPTPKITEHCQASATSRHRKICTTYSFPELPGPLVSMCSHCSCELSLQNVWLDIEGQELEFG